MTTTQIKADIYDKQVVREGYQSQMTSLIEEIALLEDQERREKQDEADALQVEIDIVDAEIASLKNQL